MLKDLLTILVDGEHLIMTRNLEPQTVLTC